jgi:uncharacterized protein DUF1841
MSLFGGDRDSLRAHFFRVWSKVEAAESLEPLEAVIAEVIAMHPEYHAVIADPERNLDRDWHPEDGETNPFLHMALHIAIKEQLMTDRPTGIVARFRSISARHPDAHAAEHEVLEALAETLWEAQSQGREPDLDAFLGRLDTRGQG